MKHDILIFGAGYIGTRLSQALDCPLSDRRIHALADIQAGIDTYRPRVIINAIARIGWKNIDDCEEDKDATLRANTFLPLLFAEAALTHQIKYVHLSTGCLYHYNYARQAPLDEDAVPDYLELAYTRSKIYAERALAALAPDQNVLIARLRLPLDNRPHPRNLLDKLVKHRRATAIPNSVTYLPDFIAALKHLITVDARGIYNLVNRSGLKFTTLLDAYRARHPDFTYEPYEPQTLNRPQLLLCTRKLAAAGFKVRDIHDVLEACVEGWTGRVAEKRL